MKSEIGSFIEINEENEQKINESVIHWLEQRMKGRHMQFVCSGREAIEAAICDIEQINSKVNKVCLLPQYTCDTVIIPFERHQWEIFYYPVDLTLNVDADKFENIIKNEKPSVVLVHPYYGMKIGEDVRNIILSYKVKTDLICIEDSTQSLSRFGECTEVDYYVASLRKWFAIPDGGVLLSQGVSVEPLREKKEFVRLKKKAQILKSMYLKECCDVPKEKFLKINQEAEQYLYMDNEICRISEYSLKQLETVDAEEMFRIRTENAAFLARHLEMFAPKIEIESPLYFPIYVEDRKELQSYLITQNIYASIIWQKPKAVLPIQNKNVKYMYTHLLSLPCDQRYTIDDMEKIVCAIAHFNEFQRCYEEK